jgi:hypothetical protein
MPTIRSAVGISGDAIAFGLERDRNRGQDIAVVVDESALDGFKTAPDLAILDIKMPRGGVPSLVQIVDGEAPPGCPACGTQMRRFADFEIYECRECRLFVSEKVRQSDVNNVNASSLEHSSRVDNAA